MKKIVVFIGSLLLTIAASGTDVHATKGAPPLPIQLTSTPTTAKPGDSVDYLVHIPNKSSNGYWGVKAIINFPSQLSCTQIVSTTRGGCTLANNTLTCAYNDVGDWWIIDAVVRCQVNVLPTCTNRIVTTGGLWANKPKQDTRISHTLNVNCALPATPTPTPTATPTTGGYRPACADGIDNDGDGLVDLADPGCDGLSDPGEHDEPTPTPASTTAVTITPTPGYTATPYATATPSKAPCALTVSRRGKHWTSRWQKEASPFSNITYPNTVTLTIGGTTVETWIMDPCNRQYGQLRVCEARRADPPSTFSYLGAEYTLISGNVIGGECKLTVGQLVSPLVIDFKMNGVQFTDAPTARFNYGKGHEPTYWIKNGSDVGFLAIDKNRNRRIDNIDELFGDKTANDEGERKYATGFEALAAYDSDRDGEINKRDEAFERLRVWFDRNSNGKTDHGELQRLSVLGIEAIMVQYEHILEFADANGNISQARSMVFLKGNPPAGIGIYDVYFARVPREERR